MSSSPTDSRSRRTSLFGLRSRAPSPLTSPNLRTENTASSKLVRKKSRFADPWSSSADPSHTDAVETNTRDAAPAAYMQSSSTTTGTPPTLRREAHRPSLARKSSRPNSIFGSLKGLRLREDDGTTASSPSTSKSMRKSPKARASEFSTHDDGGGVGRSRHVLQCGEVQISSKWLMNKKEYLVLTDTHLVRFKTASKAADVFPCITASSSKSSVHRHSSSHSIDSTPESHSFGSDSSDERDFGIPLCQIVALQVPDEGRPQSSLEIVYLENDTAQSVFLSFTFAHSDDRDIWLQALRNVANQARLTTPEPVPLALVEYAARVVERAEDYSQSSFRIYKVVKRSTPRGGRVSADDSVNASPFVCLLVIGVQKLHLIQLPKSSSRGSTPTVTDLGEGYSHGVLTVTLVSVSEKDDNFGLAFRLPCQRPRTYQLASLAASEIALAIRARDRALRPEWTAMPFLYNGPSPIDNEMQCEEDESINEFGGWSGTLTAFCVAYDTSPSIVQYSVDYDVEDGPRLILYPPARARPTSYTAYELLAILRSLRYNESFGTIDFSNISLDALNEVYDDNGDEYICEYQKNGTPIGIPFEDQARASLLVSEIRALATSNRRLRRLDFSGSINQHLADPTPKHRIPVGSGVFEALYPVCCKQSTNVDWICVNNIPLQEKDLEYLISLLAFRPCHLRGLELGGCSLTDHSFFLVLDTLRTQANTLEKLVLASNTNRLMPLPLSRSLDSFEFIRKIDLSHMSVTSGDEPLLGFDTMKRWRLEELKLAGTTLNDESVGDICAYLGHKQSEVLKTLIISSCGLSGAKIADLMEAMTTPGKPRPLTFDISDNPVASSGHDRLVTAIARNLAPMYLAMCQYEYEHEENYAEILFALAANRSIRSLHFARITLPGVATETTIFALAELLRENPTLHELDISGEDSRLEATSFGPGIIKALAGLRDNKTLVTLRVEYQKLGLPGAAALSDVIRANTSLRELYCEHNAISMSGFVDICNAVQINKSLLYMPSFEEGRATQLRHLEDQIREARTRPDGTPISPAGMVSSMRKSVARLGSLDLPGSHFASRKTPSVPQWTHQDEQHAYRMIADGWEEHIARLNGYLDRNRRFASGEAVDETEWQEARPSTAGSMSKMLETVAGASTPRAEKEVDLGAPPTSSEDAIPTHHRRLPSREALRVEVPPSVPRVPREYLQSPISYGSLAGSTLAPPSTQTARSRSTSPNSPISDTTSLQLSDIDRTPIFEQSNPFVSTSNTWRPITGDSAINVSPENLSPPALESANDSVGSESSPDLEMMTRGQRTRRASSKTMAKKPSIRLGQYNHSAAPSPPPKD